MMGGWYLALTDSPQVKQQFSLKSITSCANAIAARTQIEFHIETYGQVLDSLHYERDDIEDSETDREEEYRRIEITEQSAARDLEKIRESNPLEVLIAEYKKQDEACMIAIAKQIKDAELLQTVLRTMTQRSSGYYRVLSDFQMEQKLHALINEKINPAEELAH